MQMRNAQNRRRWNNLMHEYGFCPYATDSIYNTAQRQRNQQRSSIFRSAKRWNRFENVLVLPFCLQTEFAMRPQFCATNHITSHRRKGEKSILSSLSHAQCTPFSYIRICISSSFFPFDRLCICHKQKYLHCWWTWFWTKRLIKKKKKCERYETWTWFMNSCRWKEENKNRNRSRWCICLNESESSKLKSITIISFYIRFFFLDNYFHIGSFNSPIKIVVEILVPMLFRQRYTHRVQTK